MSATSKTLILGVGNLLLSDEGIGVRVIQRLEAFYELPQDVQVLDGGTLGLDLLYYLDDVENLLLIDAVETGKAAGTLIRLEGKDVPSFLSIKMSPHQIGISDMLFAAKLKGLDPPNIVLWGIQPESLDIGLDLSPPIASQLEHLVQHSLEELARWGIEVKARSTPLPIQDAWEGPM